MSLPFDCCLGTIQFILPKMLCLSCVCYMISWANIFILAPTLLKMDLMNRFKETFRETVDCIYTHIIRNTVFLELLVIEKLALVATENNDPSYFGTLRYPY